MADDYSVNGKMTLDNSQFLKSVDEAQSSISDFGKGIKDSTSKFSEGLKNWGVDFDKMFKKGSDLFKSFGLDIEKLASHFGVSGKLLVGIATCTMALNKFGAEMNEVSIEIAKGTGETGEKLRKLTETAEKTMVKGFGRSTKELGVMVADLNTRFGATGEQLQDLTGEFDKFARITDTDVKGSINEVADIINKWGMSTLEVNPLLDQLTVASQKSGASVADLMSGLKSGQAIFSQFGMSTTKTIAFLSSLKQNGISTESALTGMRTALAKFSSEGIEASAGLQKVISEIQNAKSDTDALNISLKTFGTRAGAEMVQAFRSGTASVDDFVSALENAGGAVEKTNEFSRSSALAMTELKNSLKGTFSGFGKGINDLFTDLIDSVKSLVEFLSPIIEPIGDIIGDVFSTIGEIIKTLIQAFTEFQTKYNTIYNGLVKTLETIKETFHKVFGNIVEQLKNVIGFISALFKGNWALVWEYAKKILLTFAKNVSDILSGIVNLFVNGVNSIIEVINKAIDKYNAVAEKFDWKKIGNVDEIGKVDFAESWGIEEQIEKIQEKIDELTGKTAEKVIGELGKVSDEAVKSAKEVSYKMSEVTAEWNAKLLQQDIELIEMERDEVAGRASIFGASEEQIFDIKKEYNDRIFELKKKQLEEEKALELENVKNSQESAEEKLKQIEAINTYYERTLKILKQVNENSSTTNKMKKYSNTLKEIGKFSNELFSSIGEALVDGGKGFEDYASIAVDMIAQVLEGLASQLSALVAVNIATKQYGSAAVAAAGAAAALVAAGALHAVANNMRAVKEATEDANNSLQEFKDRLQNITETRFSASSTLTLGIKETSKQIDLLQEKAKMLFENLKLNKIEKSSLPVDFIESFEKAFESIEGLSSSATIDSIYYLNELYKKFKFLSPVLKNTIGDIPQLVETLDLLKETNKQLVESLTNVQDSLRKTIQENDDVINSYEDFYGAFSRFKKLIEETDLDTSVNLDTSSLFNVSTLAEYEYKKYKIYMEMIKDEQKSLIQELQKDIYAQFASFGKSIGETLMDSILEGSSKADFLNSMKSFIRQTVLKMAVYTESFTEELSEVGTDLINALMGFGDLEKVTLRISKLYDNTLSITESLDAKIDEIFGNIEQTCKSSMSAFEQAMKSYKDSIKDVSGDIGSAFVDGLTNGITQGDFLKNIKDWLKKMMVQMVVYTDTMKSEVEEIGKRISEGLVKGFTDTDLHEVRRDLSFIFEEASKKVSSIDSILGSVFGFATGTLSAPKGLAVVGEAGPELVNFKGGERVYNNADTERLLTNNKVLNNNFNVTFNNLKDTTAYALLKQFKTYQRNLAFDGIL